MVIKMKILKKFCTECDSLLTENNSCSNKNCQLKKDVLQEQLDKMFYDEFQRQSTKK